MIDSIIRISLRHRALVLLLGCLLLIYGGYTFTSLPVDVLPDLNRPVVSILTESHGLAPEEVETQISFPIESALNGAAGVYRVRSASIPGLSLVWVDFDWDADTYEARQIVTEKLQQVSSALPYGTNPTLGPISSIMGEIMLLGLSSTSEVINSIELRDFAEWTLRPRLLALKGISQVSVIGGKRKQYHVVVQPEDLIRNSVSLSEIESSLQASNTNASGGYLVGSVQEKLTRTLGRFQSPKDIENSLVHRASDDRNKTSVLQIRHLAEVSLGGPISKRGDAGINGKEAVILTIQKQPDADTVELTRRIQNELALLKEALPEGVQVYDDIFQQSRFIENAIFNVKEVLRDGAILVAIILFLFLLNFRTTLITLTAIPLSITFSLIFFKYFGLSINTMTLGGLAIAIGELVDDAIVDVENIFRRLRENKLSPHPRSNLEVVYEASKEIRGSIVFATIIVILVFLPLFAMTGIEGRLFMPIGFAYVTSILGSLLVALTVTPALSYYFLPGIIQENNSRESLVVRSLKSLQTKALDVLFLRKRLAVICTSILFIIALALSTTFGKEFLPPFNEGAFTVSILLPPGTSLEESNRIGTIAESLLLEIPEIKLTGRRVGRAENDEHAQGVHAIEIEGEFEDSSRIKQEILSNIRQTLLSIPGISVNVGQPISHRIDHLLSGVRSQIAIKIFGPDLDQLRSIADEVRSVAETVPGIVDLFVEKQVLVPQIHIRINREDAALLGLTVQEISESLETALNGRIVTQMIEEQRSYDVVLRLHEEHRQSAESLRKLPIILHNGKYVPLEAVATIEEARGPNTIARENASRRIVVSANVSHVDLVSAVKELQNKLAQQITLPDGYFISYGGQFESQAKATQLIFLLGIVSLLGIFAVLYLHYRNTTLTLQIMLSVPFSFIGAILAMFLTGGVLSVASLVGLITLTGIATRNGIMMIDHYLYLMRKEGESFTLHMIYRGSSERLVPVLMTALTAILALTPIILGANEPGKEILYPVAVVIFGGLFSSTTLNLLITPLIFWHYGKGASHVVLARQKQSETQGEAD